MLILGFLGLYFDVAVVFVTNSRDQLLTFFLRLAVAILCTSCEVYVKTCKVL